MPQMIFLAAIMNFVMVIVFILLFRRNVLRLEKKNNGDVINAKLLEWKVINGKPTRYILKVEYEIKNEKYSRRMVTSGEFARKYEKERNIPVVF